jgi:hypothetical protein
MNIEDRKKHWLEIVQHAANDPAQQINIAEALADYEIGLRALRDKGYAPERMPLVYTVEQVPASA